MNTLFEESHVDVTASVKRIEGEVKHHDFRDNPDLPDWYRRRGFSVVMGNEKTAWVAKISLAV